MPRRLRSWDRDAKGSSDVWQAWTASDIASEVSLSLKCLPGSLGNLFTPAGNRSFRAASCANTNAIRRPNAQKTLEFTKLNSGVTGDSAWTPAYCEVFRASS